MEGMITFWIGWAFAIFVFVFIGVALGCSSDRIPREFGDLFLGLAGGLTFSLMVVVTIVGMPQ